MEFGFNLHTDQLIDHDSAGKAYDEIVRKVPSLATCISCGSCMGSCMAAEKTGTGFRKLVTLLRNGAYDELCRALKYCQFCGKCWLVCPRGVNTRKAILEMKSYFEVIKT